MHEYVALGGNHNVNILNVKSYTEQICSNLFRAGFSKLNAHSSLCSLTLPVESQQTSRGNL